MRFVQSSQRRRCANSCSRMTFRSWAGSSRNAQAGSTIVRFQKPMAAGTRTHSDVAIVIEFEIAFEIDPDPTDPDAPKPSRQSHHGDARTESPGKKDEKRPATGDSDRRPQASP